MFKLDEGFLFDESVDKKTGKRKHLYTLDGKPLTGTTTILGVIAKPALIPWAVKLTADYIFSRSQMGEKITVDIIDEAKRQHKNSKEAAGDWGTTLHKHIENYAKDGIVPPDAVLPGMMKPAFEHFLKWVADKKIIGSEIRVYSRRMWVGGTLDLIVEIDGQYWICDIKTGSGIYPEHFWQMGSYDTCMEELNPNFKVVGYIVLNLKKDGTFEEKRSISIEDNRKTFEAALVIYRAQEKLKANTI